jgi:hypothetical protein
VARKRNLLITLLLVLLFVNVTPVFAQSTADIELDDIIQLLGPRSGQELIYDIFLYAIFLMGIVVMFLIPDKQLLPSLLNFLVLGLAVVSKLLVGRGPSYVLSPTDFPVFVLHVGMFVIPLIIAGMLRDRRGLPKATFPAILMGLMGGGYFFLYWALEQRGGAVT